MKRTRLLPALAAAAFACAGCSIPNRLYRKADLPPEQTILDVPYTIEGRHNPAERLDLFLPKGNHWPVMVFVHGGGWDTGDKGLRVLGADVYGNIGRFLASNGVGAAVINYRLLPGCGWRDQPEDIAHAVAWVKANIAALGGDPREIFLMGHSAGAQLVTRVALDPGPLSHAGLSSEDIRGVIAVSGAGLDLEDKKTYQMEAKLSYYEKRFRERTAGEGWRHEASPIRFVRAGAPPFLILYASGETKSLQRQSQLLNDAITKAGGDSRILVVPGEDHERIVLTLSRPDKAAGPGILNFILMHSAVRAANFQSTSMKA